MKFTEISERVCVCVHVCVCVCVCECVCELCACMSKLTINDHHVHATVRSCDYGNKR